MAENFYKNDYRYPTGEIEFSSATYNKLKRVTCEVRMRKANGEWALGLTWYIQEIFQFGRVYRDHLEPRDGPPPRYHVTPANPVGNRVHDAWLIGVTLRQAKEFVRLLGAHLEKVDIRDGDKLIWKDEDALAKAILAFGEKHEIVDKVAGLLPARYLWEEIENGD